MKYFTALLTAQCVLAHPLPSPRQATAPATYTSNPSIGGGASFVAESAHFRVYGTAVTSSDAAKGLKIMEAAHQCFVVEQGWRTPGLSTKTGGIGKEVGPWYKMNIYGVKESDIPGAAAQTWTDSNAGLEFLKVVPKYIAEPGVVVHEFGHAMHYSEKNWVDQTRTGAWWETIANFVADLYISTPLCVAAKASAGLPAQGDSIIELKKIIGDSFQVLVDGTSGSGNYYQAWPFLSYITNNPDAYPGLGKTILLDMIRKYQLGSNETPLHTLSRLLGSGGVNMQKVVGRYWARMAYVDIGHQKAAAAFAAQRKSLDYANLDNKGGGKYTVKATRAPRYMGANIVPLKASGLTVTVAITASASTYTATLAVKGGSRVRYVDVVNGSGSVTLASGEEVSLVVANTPALVLYDPFSIPADLNKGLTYSVQITGATV
ncbi:uncharacterized protein N0V89_002205 [Didymosphaeria variabile]|uniref:Dockerin type 1 n=1 Tax=Didymosphaeria variabile TaxID=1932322 RepID=A0A9W8XSB9_9PLEO|nr:uncharacterized protein N0V89_002205 [Didymosphaeria variabile]KAJ4357629.1 hypothetical protein N0V89_002205 [Didymosphaeria variabile]